MERLSVLRAAAFAAMLASLSIVGSADAAPRSAAAKLRAKPGPVAWCSEDYQTLPNGLCHIDGGQREGGKRTLVIFLHGMIAKDVEWQWMQEKALARQAKQSKFEAVFARAPLGPSGYIWPGTIAAQESSEDALIAGWNEARAHLEKQNGKPYDEVFLMGFSSGAYFVSALALRGKVHFDGFAVFAGGAGGLAAADVASKSPVYVGVCADDKQTAGHSRNFGATLAARGWPYRVDEQHVGHMFSDLHVAHALGYLRGAHANKNATANANANANAN